MAYQSSASIQTSETGIAPVLPKLVALPDGQIGPQAPASVEECDVSPTELRNLALKLAYSTYQFTSEWLAERLQMQTQIAEELCQGLVKDTMLGPVGQVGPFSYRYAITTRGAEEAKRLLEISGYLGPAPVSLGSYTSLLAWQLERFPLLKPRNVAEAISTMVLPEDVVRTAGVAIASGRSLFLSGPAGNGKTSLGRLLHTALPGELWIPHCLTVDGNIIKIYDPLSHGQADAPPGAIDRRWLRVRRPLVVVGGELTIESLDLIYSPSLRYYEAPLHVKSNGGVLLIDDFGRQRVAPNELLNRWIVPLEYGIDHLTLHTGQQIQIPFQQLLVFATNLNLAQVTDSAFLRRLGYRVELGNPTREHYAEIFRRYAEIRGVEASEELIRHVVDRYAADNRELRACEPRDLIDRALDFCEFNDEEPHLSEENLSLAWEGYFGSG